MFQVGIMSFGVSSLFFYLSDGTILSIFIDVFFVITYFTEKYVVYSLINL